MCIVPLADTMYAGTESLVYTGVSVEEMLGYTIVDDVFTDTDTRLFLRGRTLMQYDKDIIIMVIQYCLDTGVEGSNTEHGPATREFLRSVMPTSFDNLMVLLGAASVEALLGHMLIAFHSRGNDIMLRLVYTYCRIPPFDKIREWYDNYRLNAYGNALNTIMYGKFDSEFIYTVSDVEPKLPINTSVTLSDTLVDRACRIIVGGLRMLTVSVHTPTYADDKTPTYTPGYTGDKAPRYTDAHTPTHTPARIPGYIDPSTLVLAGGSASRYSPVRASVELLDRFYVMHPFSFAGAHGCDTYANPAQSLSVEEIDTLLSRYPSHTIGYILNTATYASNKGEHWIALIIRYKELILVCSQGSGYDKFHDQTFINKFRALGYGTKYNTQTIQTDNYTCGMFAVLALWQSLFRNSISEIVNGIGINGSNMVPGYTVDDVRNLTTGTKQTGGKQTGVY